MKSNRSSDLADRDWRWRSDSYRYSPTRSRQQVNECCSFIISLLTSFYFSLDILEVIVSMHWQWHYIVPGLANLYFDFFFKKIRS